MIEDEAEKAAAHFRPKWHEVFKDKLPEGPKDSKQHEIKYEFRLTEAKKLLAKKAAEETPTSE